MKFNTLYATDYHTPISSNFVSRPMPINKHKHTYVMHTNFYATMTPHVHTHMQCMRIDIRITINTAYMVAFSVYVSLVMYIYRLD